ncbi:MAG: crossover junction endodeoxyribonuclease RuvC [Acidimicrobiia bacterium]
MFAPRGSAARVILGIDPGLSRCGYGAVAIDGPKLTAHCAGVIRTDPGLALPERLVAVADELDALIAELRPAAVAVERVLFQANVTTAMGVGQASGLALVAAARAGVPVVMYSPNEVKLAVTGDGRADKAQIQQMVMRVLGLREVPRPPDAADALAIAITHASSGAVKGAARTDAPSGGKSKLDAAIAAALEKHG